MTTSQRLRPTPGFTLIELLTVIAIIGILAAIIIPTVGRVRASARDASCKSNLRQIGLAVQIYGNETGFYPGSITLVNNTQILWRQLLRPYLGSREGRAGGDEQLNSRTLICDARTITPTDEPASIRPSYSAHSIIMPDLVNSNLADNKKIIRYNSISRTTQVILMADGTQQTHGGADSNLYKETELQSAKSGSTATADNFISVKSDVDGVDRGVFRFRHADNSSLNAVFLDGHVGSFKKGTIKERNVKINY